MGNPTTWPVWLSILSLIGGPATALIVLYVNDRRSKKNTDKTTEVSKQEAETNEFAVLTAGYTAAYNRLTADLETATKKAEENARELAAQTALYRTVADELVIQKALTRRLAGNVALLMEHLSVVEAMVPNPPGAPPRPALAALADDA